MSKTRINVIVEDIDKFFKELEEMKIKKVGDLDTVKFRAASMDIFSIINRIIDLADEVAKDKKLGFPMEYKDLFKMLRKARIISEKLEYDLVGLVILRNKISHRYSVLEEKDIFNALKEINIVNEFVKIIKNLK